MIEVRIDNKEYSIKDSFSDYSLSDAISVHKVIADAPENLIALYNAPSQEEIDKIELTDEDVYKLFPRFYGQVIEACSDIGEGVIEGILAEERRIIYKGYLEKIVAGLIHLPEAIDEIESFEFGGETYYLPQSKDVLGDERIGAYMSAIEFTESSDLEYYSKGLEGGKYEYAANIIAVLCRPKGEKYSEDVSLERAKVFVDLPLDVVHSVFFSLISSMQRYSLTMLTSLQAEVLGQRSPERAQTLIS